MLKIELVKAIDSPFCVSNEDGVMIHNMIIEALNRGETVEVSFAGVTRLTTAFLNAAIGQLYDEYDDTRINEVVKTTNTNLEHESKIRTTMSNAKLFFKTTPESRADLRRT